MTSLQCMLLLPGFYHFYVQLYFPRKLISPSFTSIHYDEDGEEIVTDVSVP